MSAPVRPVGGERRTDGSELLLQAAILFLSLEGLGAAAWWGVLIGWPERRTLFFPAGFPDAAVLSFVAPDLLVFAGAALASAHGLAHGRRWAWPLLLVHAGAAIYAGLYTVAMTSLSGGGWLGLALMTPPLIVVPLLAWKLRPAGPGGAETPLGCRAAREAGPAANVVKTLLQTAVFWPLFLAVFPVILARVEARLLPGASFAGPAMRMAGVLLFAAGGALGITSAMVMAVSGGGTPLPLDCPRRLVVAGPYRFVRNPMAVGGLLQGFAAGFFLGSPLVLFYTAAGLAAWHGLVRPWEEADLEARFGEEYRRYRAAVPLWIPRRWPGRTT